MQTLRDGQDARLVLVTLSAKGHKLRRHILASRRAALAERITRVDLSPEMDALAARLADALETT